MNKSLLIWDFKVITYKYNMSKSKKNLNKNAGALEL